MFRSLFLALVPLLFLAAISAPSAAAAAPPNVVLIISDDQAWTDFSFMGHEHVRTPRIDKLAEQSLTFTRGYVPSSLCRPSLATMITGLYPHQHQIVGNDPAPPPEAGGKRGAKYNELREAMISHIDDVPTLPRLLAKKGYLSHQSGKWWEGSYQRGGFTHGMTRGFPEPGGRHGDDGLKIGRQGMDPVFDFIATARKQEKPFFIWYAPFLPHTPHNPPKRLLDKYRDKTPHLPIAKYWAMCEWFDETVGQLLDHLDEQGIARDTLVLFVTDNGWINEENASRYAPRSKRSPNEGGIRTPVMVRWPGKVQPKMDKRTPVSSIDLAPTILAACGLAPTKEMQGLNLLNTQALANRDTLFGDIYEHDVVDVNKPVASLKYRWCIDGWWKLIEPYNARFPNAPSELYHLEHDPDEHRNLADSHADKVKAMRAKLDKWWAVGAQN